MKRYRLYLASVVIAVGALAGGALAVPAAGASARAARHAQAASACKLHVLGPAATAPPSGTKWKQVFSAFDAKYHCSVAATWESTFTTLPHLLNEARLSNEPVDLVFGLATALWDLASAGDLMNLTKVVAPYKKEFKPGALQPFTIDGQVWAVPYAPETLSTFIYNASLFKKLGLSVPHTFPQLAHAAKILKQKGHVLPIIVAGKTTWEWPMWYMAAFAQTSGNRSIPETAKFLSGKRKFTAPDSVAALSDLAKFSKDGLLTESSALGTSASASIAAFTKGKAAMTFNGTWDLPTILAAKPNFSVGVFPFPRVVSKGSVTVQEDGSPTSGVGIPSFISKSDLPMAEKLLKFITAPAQENTIQSMFDPVAPTATGVTPAKTPLGPTLRSMQAHTVGWLDWMWPSKVVTSVETAIEGVLFNHQSAKAAAASVQSEYQALKSQQHYDYNFWSQWSTAKKKALQP